MEECAMPVSVNGVVISDASIAGEAQSFAGEGDPFDAARRTLAVRELLLQRAGELGLLEIGAPRAAVSSATRDDEERAIAQLLECEVRTPEPTPAECQRHFDAHPDRFRSGDLAEVRHILFAVTPGTPVVALRERAEAVLAELRADPAGFAARAGELSNCPSGQQGGNLGQFGRGEMVPEFDAAVFDGEAIGILPGLVATRFGFHIIDVVHRLPGRRLPFEAVRESVASFLARRVEADALRQYVAVLAGRAAIEGVDLEAAATPLVQ
jgi:peptidyl-prolyl cis-trans isomerase C